MRFIIIIVCCFQQLVAEQSITLEPIRVDESFIVPDHSNHYAQDDLEMRDVDSLDDLSTVVPSFSISTYGSRNVVFTSYRGLANFMTTGSPIAIAIDDIPISYADTFLAHELYNISDVTVLQGPQGFTTGLGAQAGIIQLHMDDTFVEKAEVSTEVGVANYGERSMVLHSKTPIENGVMNIDALYKKRDGFTKNLYNNTSLDDEETKAFSFRMVKNYEHFKLTLLGMKDFNDDGGTPYHDNLETPFVMNQNINGYVRQQNLLGSVKLEYFTDDFSLKSVSSLHSYSSQELLDGDRTPENLLTIDSDESHKEFSEELTLQIQKSDWELTSGIFFSSRYEHDYIENHSYEYFGMNGYRTWQTSQPEKNVALFGEYTKSLNENIKMTAGLRYTWNEKEFDNSIKQFFPVEVPEYGLVNGVVPEIITTKRWSKLLPKFKVVYEKDSANFVFFQYAKSFKNGGYGYDDYDPDTVSYDPESSDTFELGFNTKFSDSLSLNGTLYVNYVDNLQVETTRPDLSSYIDNAANATIYGLESEFRYKANENVSLYSSLGLIHSKFDEYISNFNDYSGNQLINVPEYTFQVGSEYNFDQNYYINLVLKSNGKTYFDKANSVSQSSYAYGDAKIGFKSKTFSWNIYVHNLLDKRYLNYVVATEEFSAYNFGEPRRVGAALTYHF